MSIKLLTTQVENAYKEKDFDGFDLAFYQGIEHILENTGDGGISQQYINGIKSALNVLSSEEIEGYK